jgi:hypothetical protein
MNRAGFAGGRHEESASIDPPLERLISEIRVSVRTIGVMSIDQDDVVSDAVAILLTKLDKVTDMNIDDACRYARGITFSLLLRMCADRRQGVQT